MFNVKYITSVLYPSSQNCSSLVSGAVSSPTLVGNNVKLSVVACGDSFCCMKSQSDRLQSAVGPQALLFIMPAVGERNVHKMNTDKYSPLITSTLFGLQGLEIGKHLPLLGRLHCKAHKSRCTGTFTPRLLFVWHQFSLTRNDAVTTNLHFCVHDRSPEDKKMNVSCVAAEDVTGCNTAFIHCINPGLFVEGQTHFKFYFLWENK